jgi:hypothetical protein
LNSEEKTELSNKERILLAKILEASSSKSLTTEAEKVASIIKFLKSLS